MCLYAERNKIDYIKAYRSSWEKTSKTNFIFKKKRENQNKNKRNYFSAFIFNGNKNKKWVTLVQLIYFLLIILSISIYNNVLYFVIAFIPCLKWLFDYVSLEIHSDFWSDHMECYLIHFLRYFFLPFSRSKFPRFTSESLNQKKILDSMRSRSQRISNWAQYMLCFHAHIMTGNTYYENWSLVQYLSMGHSDVAKVM